MYKENFERAIEAIRSNPFVDLIELVVNEPATPQLIDAVEIHSSIYLPQKIKDFYMYANGLKCTWTVKPDLDANTMDKIKAHGEQLDFDYSKPLGSIKILPVQDMLMDKYWQTPYQDGSEAAKETQFCGINIDQRLFAKKLKIFDAYFVNNDEECIALLTDFIIGNEKFHMILLDNYLSDWRQSHIMDFESYFLCMCESRFTIPCRRKIFAKGYSTVVERKSFGSIDKMDLIPFLFR